MLYSLNKCMLRWACLGSIFLVNGGVTEGNLLKNKMTYKYYFLNIHNNIMFIV